MKIYAVRHGQTIFNTLDKVQGWADTPLTDQGKQDGQAAGRRLQNVKFDAAISSDTSRAIHTAEYILSANNRDSPKLTFTSDWREYFFGSFEGGLNADVWKATGQALGIDSDSPDEITKQADMTTIMDTIYQIDPKHLGESASDFWQRIDHSLVTLHKTYASDATVLLVSHGQLIWNLAQHYGHLSTANRPQNGAVAVFDMANDGTLSVEMFNDTSTVF